MARPNKKRPEERGSLVIIKVNLGLGEKKFYVNAIIDSGSELNKEYPVLPLEEACCANANGNQSILTGKFSEVMLFQGTVATSAALFVGSQKDPYDKGWQTELLVVSEPWNVQTEGPIPVNFMKQEDIEFEGLWKLWDRESIVPSDQENTESSDSMSSDTEETEDDSDEYSEDIESSMRRLLDEQEQNVHSKVIHWLENCWPLSPILSAARQASGASKEQRATVMTKVYSPAEQESRSLLGVLRYLQNQLNPFDIESSIGLSVPADYSSTNTQIEIYS
ncbi:hypothetical protein EV421DRAFT_1741363 [Armillaria borealis]|uniref:Uncharacterized protein n=1 Tax=Armillaria borealis TaxID=47425 RepID=A0AA39J040_9AGAR|nr:hypothetical protein EV421DRAFT_1741363 [Armillaria borealis]